MNCKNRLSHSPCPTPFPSWYKRSAFISKHVFSETFGYDPKTPFDRGIEMSVEWYRKNT